MVIHRRNSECLFAEDGDQGGVPVRGFVAVLMHRAQLFAVLDDSKIMKQTGKFVDFEVGPEATVVALESMFADLSAVGDRAFVRRVVNGEGGDKDMAARSNPITNSFNKLHGMRPRILLDDAAQQDSGKCEIFLRKILKTGVMGDNREIFIGGDSGDCIEPYSRAIDGMDGIPLSRQEERMPPLPGADIKNRA